MAIKNIWGEESRQFFQEMRNTKFHASENKHRVKPSQDGPFGGCSRMVREKRYPLLKICHTYLTLMKFRTVML